MKPIRFGAVLLCALLFTSDFSYAQRASHAASEDDHILEGKILDKQTGMPLAGVTIYLNDLKRGAVSHTDGTYRIAQLPHIRTHVRISLIGYKIIVETVDLSNVSVKNFELEESLIETPEVVVSGVSQATEKKRMPLPISIVTNDELRQSSATNLVEALSSQPGVSAISTGPALAKPVIRGLGYNRVLVMHDGVRQEGQQWGDEHGVEVDAFGVQTVEILKGPASLMYGSDALAGVIQMLTAHPVEDGKIMAGVDADYASNNGQASVSLSSQANYHNWMWDLRYSHQQAHDYSNSLDGYVLNSGFRSDAAHAVIGYSGQWGYTQLHLSQYLLLPGIVEGRRDSVGKFLKDVALNGTIQAQEGSPDDALAYSTLIPHQHVEHSKVNSESQFVVGDASVYVNLGWQRNIRREYADVLQPNTPGLALDLQTLTYDVHCTLPPLKSIELSAGVNGMLQNSRNTGIEFLIPEYQVSDIGGFIVGTTRTDNWDFSAGLRVDTRTTTATALYLDSLGRPVAPSATSILRFASLQHSTPGVSASIGASWQGTDNLTLKFNLGRGFRSPNINELSANGIHEGSLRYEIGNAALRTESNTQADLGLLFQTEHINVEVSLFANAIQNFIFQRKLLALSGADSTREGYDVFVFDQSTALLYGAECIVDLHPHPLDWLHIENSFGFVIATMPGHADSTRFLPFTPAPKWSCSLKAQFLALSSSLRTLSVNLTSDFVFAQHNIYSAYATETITDAYELLHLQIQTEWKIDSHTGYRLSFGVNNLLNTVYQSHLSRLKYLDINPENGKMGVFAIGRSFVLKLSVPIEIL